MSTIDQTATQNLGTQRHPVTRASGAEQPAVAWADGVFVVPLLWLVVMGYQVLVVMLKVVNRERPAACGGRVRGEAVATNAPGG